jgi:hypothetical protein
MPFIGAAGVEEYPRPFVGAAGVEEYPKPFPGAAGVELYPMPFIDGDGGGEDDDGALAPSGTANCIGGGGASSGELAGSESPACNRAIRSAVAEGAANVLRAC